MAPNNPPVLLAQLALLALGCAAAGDSSWRDLTWWQLQALSTGEKLPVSALQGPPAASHLQDHLPSHLQAHLPSHLQPQDHRKLKDHLKGTYNIIVANGYPAEEHTVHTEDGYILNMYRIPNPGRTVVYLQHGLLSSSADWVFLGKGRALAFLLHDAGYDVWMGNNRGTTPSRRHEQLKPSDAKFWDFSWHEIGVHDLPAEIDHVLAATNHSQLHFVGHSQGTTTFFVLGSERPEYMTKVKTFTALAPIAYLRDVRSIPVRLMAIAPNTLNFVLKMIGVNEFLPSSELISWLGDLVCTEGHVTQGLCDNILFIIVGADQAQINQTIIPDFLANTPAGASTKQLLHYGQLVKTKDLEFKKFDYGLVSNLLKYRSIKPPSYDLSRVTALTYMMYSDNDLLSVHSNVIQLSQKLPNIAEGGVRKVPFEKWNHLDYLLGTNAKEFVYDEVIDIIQAYEHRS